MAIDVGPFINPATTAVVALEVQENLVLPDRSVLPGLAKAAVENNMVANIASLADSARSVGSRVYFVCDQRRKDRFGHANNTFVHRKMTGEREWSGGHGEIVAELTPKPEDIYLERQQGMTGFFTTSLDMYFRNTGVTTVILTGVSANLSLVGTAIEGMNLGYRIIVPRDCIAGDPMTYVDDLLKYTIRNIALVTTSDVIKDYWASLG